MNTLRRLAVALAGSLLALSLFGFVFLLGLLQLIMQPEKVKTLLSDSNVYSTIVPSVIEESTKEQSESQGDDDSVPLNTAEIATAAEKAFSPDFLKTSSETFIDSLYRWLEGETAQPDFVIDLSAAKATFASEAAKNLKGRLDTLPVCTPGELSQDFDAFSATCKPAGFNADAEVARIQSEIANSKDFLENPQLTAQTLTTEENGQKVSVFENLADVPSAYQRIKLVPIILGTLALLSSLVIIFASASRRKGIKRVAVSFVASGIVVLILYALTTFGSAKVSETVRTTQNSSSLSNSLADLAARAIGSINSLYLACGIIYLAIGISVLVTLRLTRPKKDPIPSEHDPEHASPAHPHAETTQSPPAKKPPTLVQ